MKFLVNLITRIRQEKVTPLGRWNIIYSDTRLNRKIDLANEDNCGPCGEYALQQIQTTPKPVSIAVIQRYSQNDYPRSNNKTV